MNLRWRQLEVECDFPIMHKKYGFSTANLVGSKIVMYGGTFGSIRKNSVYIFDIPERRWEKVKTDETFPVRTLHTSVLFDDKLFIFGGYDTFEKRSELMKFDLVTRTWELVHPRRDAPGVVVAHSSCYLCSRESMLVFATQHEGDLGSLFEYKFEPHLWLPVPSKGEQPGGRTRHVSALFGQLWFIYGISQGSRKALFVLDTHLRFPVWSTVSIDPGLRFPGQGPVQFFHGKMLIFRADETEERHRKLWYYDPKAMTTARFVNKDAIRPFEETDNTVEGTPPGRRYAHLMVANHSQVFIFGGHGAPFHQMYVLEPVGRV